MIEIMSDDWSRPFEGASVRTLKAGSALFLRNDPVENAFLVRKGRISLRRALKDGGLLTLHTANAGELVAEASLFADFYHCDAITDVATDVAVLPRKTLMKHLSRVSSADHLSVRAFERTAKELQTLRTRIEIMRLRKVADRLDAYLELYGPPDAGEWVRIADWIGVSPAALYRELANRRTNKSSPLEFGDRKP